MLNCQYRGIDRTTDVLSFPQNSAEELKSRGAVVSFRVPCRTSGLQTSHRIFPLGDIVINLHKAERQAAEYGLTLNEELKRLLIHGLLHLTGYDHEKGVYAERKMREKTRHMLAKLGKT
jgi:probable rRNA maturation factor